MKRSFLFLLLATLPLVAGCGGIELPDESETHTKKQQALTVQARTLSGEVLDYPLVVSAFGSDGRCVAQQTLPSAETPLSLHLPAGTYRLIAVSGQEAYTASSSSPTLNDLWAMPSENHVASKPLMRGEATVTLTSGSVKVSLLMAHVVAAVTVELTDIPPEVNGVAVQLHPQYSKLSWGNAYSEPQTATLVCHKTETGVWTTGQQYVFPSAQTSTTLTLSLTNGTETQHYGYTLNAPLKAATPYWLRGRFTTDSGIGIGGEILGGGWNAVVSRDFEFGSSSGIDIGHETPPEASSDEVVTTSFPTAGTLWQGHAVAYVAMRNESEAEVLLLSLADWSGLSSALSATNAADASNIAAAYAEGGWTGWRIPNREEARYLSDTYRDAALASFNAVLEGAGASPLWAIENEKNVRYLCEDGQATYDHRGGSILAAGKTVKTYHLRLVKSIRVKRSS